MKRNNFLFSIIFGFFIIFSIFTFPNIDAQNEKISELEDIVKNNPKNLDNILQLAVTYYESGMCEKAISLYNEIVDIRSNYPEVIFGKAICLNQLGLPEQSLLILDTVPSQNKNDIPILLTKGNSHLMLKESDKAEEYFKKVLEKNPDSESGLISMITLAKQLRDHKMAETFLAKLFGETPAPSQINPQSGIMQFALSFNDSEIYSASLQMQIRNSADKLVAIVESETILHVPHPLMYEILDNNAIFVETIQNDAGIFEIRKIIVKDSEPIISPYFLDRATLSFDKYVVFFAYNMAIPIEEGDYTISEWTIKKKIG